MDLEIIPTGKKPYEVIKNKILDETNGTEAVLVDCFADWCGPCRTIQPILKKFAANPEFSKVEFLRLNVDEHPDEAVRRNIRGVPTFLVFERKERKERKDKGDAMTDEVDVTDEFVGASPRAVEQMLVKAARKIAAAEKTAVAEAAGAAGTTGTSSVTPTTEETRQETRQETREAPAIAPDPEKGMTAAVKNISTTRARENATSAPAEK